MTDIAPADAGRRAPPHSSEHDLFHLQSTYNPVPSSVEFDIDYSHGVELVIRIGSPATVHLIFKDQRRSSIFRLISGGMLLNNSPETLTATLSDDGQSVLIVPKALGSTIVSYALCRCLTTSLIVRVTNRVGLLRPHLDIREAVLNFLQAVSTYYQPKTIDDITGYMLVARRDNLVDYAQADRRSLEGALEKLAEEGLVRQNGEFWQPLNPASALDLR
jgi:hypothetical protein